MKHCFFTVLLSFLGYYICYAQSVSMTQCVKLSNGELFITENGEDFLVNKKIVTVRKRTSEQIVPDCYKQKASRLSTYIDIEVPVGTDIQDYVNLLKKNGEFASVEYRGVGKFDLTPNDYYYNRLWHIPAINIDAAWDITTGDSCVKVAIIDSGIEASHSDIGVGTDGYSNVNTSLGWDYTNNVNYSSPIYNHGTVVAGIVGAKTNNGRGVSGVTGGNYSKGITLIPYCISNDSLISNTEFICDAIIDAVGKGAKVINLSLHSSFNSDISESIQYAFNNGVSVVCASGNQSSSYVAYPASHANTIAVGASNNQNMRYDISNYGVGLDFLAPGVSIGTTILSSNYGEATGTSASAAIVSGVVALMLSVNPTLTPTEIRNILRYTCTKPSGYSYNSDGWNQEVGYGIVNAEEAVRAAGMNISGSSNMYGTHVYSVNNLPAGFSVAWSFTGSYIFPDNLSGEEGSNRLGGGLQPPGLITPYTLLLNLPNQNQCTLTYDERAMSFSGVLTADIYSNSSLVCSLSKNLTYTYYPFYVGTYSQLDQFNSSHIWDIPTTDFVDGATLGCNVKSRITLNSTYFTSYPPSYSGASLSEWNNYNNGTVTLKFPYSNSNVQHGTIRGTESNGTVVYEFYLSAAPAGSNLLSLMMKQGHESLNVSFQELAGDVLSTSTQGTSEEVDGWDIVVTNIEKGTIVYKDHITVPEATIPTKNWSKGVYAVTVINGDEVYSRSFIIK